VSQFELETDAALAQLSFEELAKTPGGEFAEIIGDLLALAGVAGSWAVAGGASNLLLKIRRLAGASYADNLIFTITAVRNDLADLYAKHSELRQRIESLANDAAFANAISALALRAMHTSVEGRLKRLAQIVVNGVKENNLEPEGIDDMMRAAVELTGRDVRLLERIYTRQRQILADAQKWPMQWYDNVRRDWQAWTVEEAADFRQGTRSFFELKASLSRLAAFGFIIAVPPVGTSNSPGADPYAILLEGENFHKRLQETIEGL
jgi:hypothetical protein